MYNFFSFFFLLKILLWHYSAFNHNCPQKLLYCDLQMFCSRITKQVLTFNEKLVMLIVNWKNSYIFLKYFFFWFLIWAKKLSDLYFFTLLCLGRDLWVFFLYSRGLDWQRFRWNSLKRHSHIFVKKSFRRYYIILFTKWFSFF